MVRSNHDKALHIKSLEERLSYFDEMKDSLSQSVLIAQDTAERVKHAATERANNIIHQAEQDAQRLLEEAKYKAMKFFVKQLTMLRRLLLKQKN